MKKKVVIISVAVVTLMFGYFSFVRISEKASGTIRYMYENSVVETEISRDDMKTVEKILDGKFIDVFMLPACGYSEDTALIIGGNTFCVACDACGTVYYKERRGYLQLNDEENRALRSLFKKYGCLDILMG